MKTDKITAIERVGERETMDIQVGDDHLYFANGILVSNSMALPMTVDFFVSMISTDELELQNMQVWKQLKNRFKDMSERKRFGIGVDKSYMRLRNITNEEQKQFSLDFKPDNGGGRKYGGNANDDDQDDSTYLPPPRKMIE